MPIHAGACAGGAACKENAKPLNLTEAWTRLAAKFREHGGALWFKGKGGAP
jgi:hypothetical protein